MWLSLWPLKNAHASGSFALRVAVGEPTVSGDAYRTLAQTLGDAAFVKTRGQYRPERWFVQRTRGPDEGKTSVIGARIATTSSL